MDKHSNTLNPLSDHTPKEVVELLQKMADLSLSEPAQENIELILSALGEGLTVLDVVNACESVPGLREFAVRLGAFCLPGSGYKAIFDREFVSMES